MFRREVVYTRVDKSNGQGGSTFSLRRQYRGFLDGQYLLLFDVMLSDSLTNTGMTVYSS